MSAAIDVVTIFHNEENRVQADGLVQQLEAVEGRRVRVLRVDNRVVNRGFAKGCNYGAAIPLPDPAPVLGFVNPDCDVTGPFVDRVYESLVNARVCGEKFGKPPSDIRVWGCPDWVCGACMFTTRAWFDEIGGFDEQFVWSWEETDFVRTTFARGGTVKSLRLPFIHRQDGAADETDVSYKQHWFQQGQKRFYAKWGVTPQRRRGRLR